MQKMLVTIRPLPFLENSRIFAFQLTTQQLRTQNLKKLAQQSASVQLLEKIVSLAKRRGFVFQSSEIYGGLNGCWDYGPLGVEMLRNVKEAWWRAMTHRSPRYRRLGCCDPDASESLGSFRACAEFFRSDGGLQIVQGKSSGSIIFFRR